MDELSIGLDFVKNVDKNWKNRLKSIDKMQNNYEDISTKPFFNNLRDNFELKNITEESQIDYWQYWKKKYSIIR